MKQNGKHKAATLVSALILAAAALASLSGNTGGPPEPTARETYEPYRRPPAEETYAAGGREQDAISHTPEIPEFGIDASARPGGAPAATAGGSEPADSAAKPLETPPETPPAPSEVVVAVGGDVLPLGRIGARIESGEYDAVLDAATAQRFRDADVAMINLESSVSSRGEPIPEKAYTFRSPPENLRFLTDWLGADVASIANNHTLDYGWDAFHDTIASLDEYGIAHIGGGADVSDAARPYVAETRGVKIAFFAANQILTYANWAAGDGKPGQLIARDAKNLGALGAAIADARAYCEYIVVYMHWGIELDAIPYERQTSVARALVDAGADVVIGAHPHVVQSFEYYNGKPIIYSIGNFLFNANNPDIAVVFLRFGVAERSVTVEVAPARVQGTLTSALDAAAGRRLLDAWEAISPGVAFGDDGIMRDKSQEDAQ